MPACGRAEFTDAQVVRQRARVVPNWFKDECPNVLSLIALLVSIATAELTGFASVTRNLVDMAADQAPQAGRDMAAVMLQRGLRHTH